jgi:hypothetical protein
MAHILIATPCYGKVLGEGYAHSLLATMDLLRSKGHQAQLYTLGNESLITRARNNITAHFLSTKADHLMFIDADITWPAQALLDLVESDFDLCGIPYPTKMRDWSKALQFVTKKTQASEPINVKELMNSTLRFTINHSKNLNNKKEGWREVTAIGTGFMLIKRHVIEKMRDHFYEALHYKNDIKGYSSLEDQNCVGLFETLIDPITRRYLSEDYAFCRRWIDLGRRGAQRVSKVIVRRWV